MNYKEFKDIKLSRLGLGNMRLPLENPNDPSSSINYPEAHKIMDLAFESGINYFDTAYVYNAGDSEKCVGAWLGKRPDDRDKVYVATKFNIDANPDYEAVFEEQLKRLQTDRIDFYLLHCLMNSNYDKYVNSGALAYFEEQRAKGRIKYLGFSSHADVEVLEKFADFHKWDFAQLQINYYDWLFGTAKAEYEILEKRNIPVMVMEPVRGGRLATLTENTDAQLKAARPDLSIASWALRFVENLPSVAVVLSGMSTPEQVEDNVKTFSDPIIITDDEMKVLLDVAAEFKTQLQVPCTGCSYCTADCPKQINIPAFLKIYNDFKVDGAWALQGMKNVESTGKPEDCIACKKCMGHCPQGIQIPDCLAELAKANK